MHRRITGRLVIATHNPGKLAEMRELLAPHGVEAISAGDLGLGEPEETGQTFRANAAIKAIAAANTSTANQSLLDFRKDFPCGQAADSPTNCAPSLERGVVKYAEGSVLVKFGDTHVLCTASSRTGCRPG